MTDAEQTTQHRLQALRPSPDGRFLVTEDGAPFFWVGDTAWPLITRLTREDIADYLADRAARGFNVVQLVVLGGPFEGLDDVNRYGEQAIHDRDITRPNEAYFALLDWAIDRAAGHGIRFAMLPVWGGALVGGLGGSGFFTPDTAYRYGEWIGARYRDRGAIWVLGGDTNPVWPAGRELVGVLEGRETARGTRPVLQDFRPIYDAMGEGIVAGAGPDALITYHPSPLHYSGSAEPRTSPYFHEREWFGLNMIQSSHHRHNADEIYPGLGSDYTLHADENHLHIRAEYDSLPVRPIVDGEPRYEDIPVDVSYSPERGFFTSRDTRVTAYRSVFSGAAGHTFGNLHLHMMHDQELFPQSFYPNATHWREALGSEGAESMTHLGALLRSRPFFGRIPDQSVIVGDPGTRTDYVAATRDRDGAYLMVHLPRSQPVTVDTSVLAGTPRAWWYDGRTGTATEAAPFRSEGRVLEFRPPTGPETDVVLVIDAAERGFPAPGSAVVAG